MLRCMLKSVVGRIYMNPLQTLPRNQIFLLQVEKNLFKKLDASSTCWATCCFNLQERNFDVWQFLRWVEILFVQQRFWTRNATMFRLQVSAICCSYYFTVAQLGPSLETLDIAFRTSAVHQPRQFGLYFNTTYAEHGTFIVLIEN